MLKASYFVTQVWILKASQRMALPSIRRLFPSEANLIIKAIIVVPELLVVGDVSDAAVERLDSSINQSHIWELQRKQETVKLILSICTWQAMCVVGMNFRNCFPMIKGKPASD